MQQSCNIMVWTWDRASSYSKTCGQTLDNAGTSGVHFTEGHLVVIQSLWNCFAILWYMTSRLLQILATITLLAFGSQPNKIPTNFAILWKWAHFMGALSIWLVLYAEQMLEAQWGLNQMTSSAPFQCKDHLSRYVDSHVKDTMVPKTVLSSTWGSLYW